MKHLYNLRDRIFNVAGRAVTFLKAHRREVLIFVAGMGLMFALLALSGCSGIERLPR